MSGPRASEAERAARVLRTQDVVDHIDAQLKKIGRARTACAAGRRDELKVLRAWLVKDSGS